MSTVERTSHRTGLRRSSSPTAADSSPTAASVRPEVAVTRPHGSTVKA